MTCSADEVRPVPAEVTAVTLYQYTVPGLSPASEVLSAVTLGAIAVHDPFALVDRSTR
jgi:hypothetical protein